MLVESIALTGTIGAWGWIGVVPLATALIGFCPVYPLLKINTAGKRAAA